MEPVSWYGEPSAWPAILVIINIWKNVGMNSVIYYAAMMGIDESQFEAAKIDGASDRQITRKIIIPGIMGLIIMMTILNIGNIFRADFGLFYQTTRDVGTLYPTTDIINTYVFRGLKNGNLSVSAAIGLVQSVLGLIMVVGVNKIVQKISPENSLF
jgi:putative aldouronate transport system permease protein